MIPIQNDFANTQLALINPKFKKAVTRIVTTLHLWVRVTTKQIKKGQSSIPQEGVFKKIK